MAAAPAIPTIPDQVDAWAGFIAGPWHTGVDVRDFIQRNYTPYEGDAGFLGRPEPCGPPRSVRRSPGCSPRSANGGLRH